mmetsp:Transcript_40384/g.104699  ORF Transcript_40384/g.104699 Transcript_40384/m.104699 type:complete len:277 (-) Transcript_40384:876-1706(-)
MDIQGGAFGNDASHMRVQGESNGDYFSATELWSGDAERWILGQGVDNSLSLVYAAAGAASSPTSPTSPLRMEAGTPSNSIYVKTNSYVGIGTDNPQFQLDVAGQAAFSQNILITSDIRKKENVKLVEHAKEKVMSLHSVMYNYKGDSKRHHGYIAQEVEKVFPDLVGTGPDGYKAVDYYGVSSVFLEAFREQQSEIDLQERKISAAKEALKAKASIIRAQSERVMQAEAKLRVFKLASIAVASMILLAASYLIHVRIASSKKEKLEKTSQPIMEVV